jgi:phosphoesterase RecJ-like protein
MTLTPAQPLPGPDQRFLDVLLGAKRILVMGHLHPDGDSVGSSVALTLALASLGREVTMGYYGRLYQHLRFLVENLACCRLITSEKSELAEFDLLVMVDCLHPDRIWDGFSDLGSLPPRLIIDHHPGDPFKAAPLAVYHNYLVSSTGELVFKVIENLAVTWTRPLAESLLAAIMSDTGFFSQNNTTPECFRQASFLIAAGARTEYVVSRLKRNWTQARVRLLRAALGALEISPNGQLASVILTQAMLDEAGATFDDMEGFVEYPRSLAGVEVAALFRVDGRGRTRVSLRSGITYSVKELAERYGGGGHRQAAAYTDPAADPAEARARFMAEAFLYLKPL